MSAIANRYAKALADVVGTTGDYSAAKEALDGFNQLMLGHQELQSIFHNPTIPQAQKQGVLKAILARVKPSPVIANFLTLLVENHRLPQLNEIVAAFHREVDRRQGVVSAVVTTSAPIANDLQQQLANKLNQLTGKRVRLQFQTDPEIIGGVVTRIGSVIYDGSIRNQLQQFKRRLSQE